MLLIDPRLEHISRRLSKLDKRVLRCFELKTTGDRVALDDEIRDLRDERAELMRAFDEISQYQISPRALRGFSNGPAGGSAETSATRPRDNRGRR